MMTSYAQIFEHRVHHFVHIFLRTAAGDTVSCYYVAVTVTVEAAVNDDDGMSLKTFNVCRGFIVLTPTLSLLCMA